MQHVPYRGTGAIWSDFLTGQVLNDPTIQARLADLGAAPFIATAAETRHSPPTKT
jgi:hypothetical protein